MFNTGNSIIIEPGSKTMSINMQDMLISFTFNYYSISNQKTAVQLTLSFDNYKQSRNLIKIIKTKKLNKFREQVASQTLFDHDKMERFILSFITKPSFHTLVFDKIFFPIITANINKEQLLASSIYAILDGSFDEQLRRRDILLSLVPQDTSFFNSIFYNNIELDELVNNNEPAVLINPWPADYDNHSSYYFSSQKFTNNSVITRLKAFDYAHWIGVLPSILTMLVPFALNPIFNTLIPDSFIKDYMSQFLVANTIRQLLDGGFSLADLISFFMANLFGATDAFFSFAWIPLRFQFSKEGSLTNNNLSKNTTISESFSRYISNLGAKTIVNRHNILTIMYDKIISLISNFYGVLDMTKYELDMATYIVVYCLETIAYAKVAQLYHNMPSTYTLLKPTIEYLQSIMTNFIHSIDFMFGKPYSIIDMLNLLFNAFTQFSQVVMYYFGAFNIIIIPTSICLLLCVGYLFFNINKTKEMTIVNE